MSEASFIPVNRRLKLAFPPVEESTSKSGVLLPDSYVKAPQKFKRAQVLSVSLDCSEAFRSCVGKDVFVECSMVEKIDLFGEEINLVLENYILGIVG